MLPAATSVAAARPSKPMKHSDSSLPEASPSSDLDLVRRRKARVRLSRFVSACVMTISGCLVPPSPDSAPNMNSNQNQAAGTSTDRTMYLKCTITEEGRVEDCRVLSPPSKID